MQKSLLFCSIFILLLVFTAQAQQPPRAWDLGFSNQPGQITLFDGPIGASTTGKPVELGDFDGDGCGDVAITGQNARGGGGQVRVVFGLCERWGNHYDLFVADETRPPMLNIWGEAPGDMFGTELYHADFNQDGYDDLAVGAQNADFIQQGRVDVGAVYIILGAPDLAERGTIDLSLSTDGVLRIYGGYYADRLGIWVEGGDFDGDGFPDVLIGADQGDGLEAARRPNAGEVYVIYGAEDLLGLYGAVVDLEQHTAGAGITLLIGVDPDDLLGSTVFGADLNKDGIDDILASAALWRGSAGVGGIAIGGGDGPANARYNGGETYIIFGNRELRGQIIDLRNYIDDTGAPVNDSLSVIYGASASDIMGEEIITGDLNGDGWTDVVVGSLAAPGRDDARVDGGEAWVIYGDEDFPGKMIDLAVPGAGLPIYAAEADSKGGDTMLIADMDGDGFDDLLYGMPNADVAQTDGKLRQNAGVLAVLYGSAEGFPTTDGIIDFAALPPDLRVDFWLGADPFDMAAYGMASGDIDGDGYPDIAINGMNGDGPDDKRPDAGEIYIISGKVFAEYSGSDLVLAVNSVGTQISYDPTVSILAEIENAPSVDASTSLSLSEGKVLYETSCAGCHGFDGRGFVGIAVNLVDSPYLNPAMVTDAELLAFIRVGRTGDSPYSRIGRPMPASGGNPNLTDAELMAIIQYIRSLR